MVMAGTGESARLWEGWSHALTVGASGSEMEAWMACTGGSLPGRGVTLPTVQVCAAEGEARTCGPERSLRQRRGARGRGGARGGAGQRRAGEAAAGATLQGAVTTAGSAGGGGAVAAAAGGGRSRDPVPVGVNLVELGPLDQQPLVGGGVHDEHRLLVGDRHGDARVLRGGAGAQAGGGWPKLDLHHSLLAKAVVIEVRLQLRERSGPKGVHHAAQASGTSRVTIVSERGESVGMSL